jgi:hypothetical protein
MDISIQQALLDNSLVVGKIYENLDLKISRISQNKLQQNNDVCRVDFADNTYTIISSKSSISIK